MISRSRRGITSTRRSSITTVVVGGGIGRLQSSVTHPRVAIATGCATVLPRPCKTVPTVTTGVVVVAGGGGIVVAVVVGIVVAGAGGIVGGIEGAGRGTGDLLLLLFP